MRAPPVGGAAPAGVLGGLFAGAAWMRLDAVLRAPIGSGQTRVEVADDLRWLIAVAELPVGVAIRPPRGSAGCAGFVSPWSVRRCLSSTSRSWWSATRAKASTSVPLLLFLLDAPPWSLTWPGGSVSCVSRLANFAPRSPTCRRGSGGIVVRRPRSGGRPRPGSVSAFALRAARRRAASWLGSARVIGTVPSCEGARVTGELVRGLTFRVRS